MKNNNKNFSNISIEEMNTYWINSKK